MNLRSKYVANFIPSPNIDAYGCHVKSDHTQKDAGRIAEPQSALPDPSSDVLIYHFPPDIPGSNSLCDEEIEIFVHAVPGDTGIYYIYYPSEPKGEVSIIPFESRFEAAAFILGKEDGNLERLTEPDRHRIRFHFPEYFQDRE